MNRNKQIKSMLRHRRDCRVSTLRKVLLKQCLLPTCFFIFGTYFKLLIFNHLA